MSDDTRRHTTQFPIIDAFFIVVCSRSALKRSSIEIVLDRVPVRRLNQRFTSTSRYSLLPLPYTWIQFSFVLRWQQVTRYRFHLASLPGVFPSTIIDEISRNGSHCWRFPRVKEEEEGKGEGETITRTDPPNDSYVPILQYSYNRCSIIFGNSDSSILLISSVLFRN